MAGRLHGKAQALGADELVRVERDVWAGSALATAAIEGEKLNLEGVRSSVTARLGLSVPDDTAPKSIEALFEVMSDAAHWPEALTAEQLVAW